MAEDIRHDSRGALVPQPEVVESVATDLHANLGALIAKQWHLPPELVTAIRYHHNPDAEKSPAESVKNRFAFALSCAAALGHHLRPRRLDPVLSDDEKAALDKGLAHLGVTDLDELWSESRTAFGAYDRSIVGRTATRGPIGRHPDTSRPERSSGRDPRDDGPTPA